MAELLVRRATPPINWRGVPPRFVNRVSAVCRSLQDCEDLVKWYGDPSFCPLLPVLIQGPAGWTAIQGLGFAPAAELRDLAVAVWHQDGEAMAKWGALVDFDELRERAGMPPRAQKWDAILDAVERRVKQHKKNPISDPFRVPQYVRVNDKRVFPMPGKENK